VEPGEGNPEGKPDPCSYEKPTRRPLGRTERWSQLRNTLRERPYSTEIENRRPDNVASLQLGKKVARAHICLFGRSARRRDLSWAAYEEMSGIKLALWNVNGKEWIHYSAV